MRRRRGAALGEFFGGLLEGDPVAWSIAGGFLVVAAIAAVIVWRVHISLKKEDESRRKRYGSE
jgi:hypothetical protein